MWLAMPTPRKRALWKSPMRPLGHTRYRMEIADFGRVFNPLEADPPDLSRGLADRPIGGLGVFLVRSMVDSIDYRREQDRNILSFVFP